MNHRELLDAVDQAIHDTHHRTTHLPSRPSWHCRACQQAWPCPTRKRELSAEFAGSRLSLAFYLLAWLRAATHDHPDQQAELTARYIHDVRTIPLGTTQPRALTVTTTITASDAAIFARAWSANARTGDDVRAEAITLVALHQPTEDGAMCQGCLDLGRLAAPVCQYSEWGKAALHALEQAA